METNELESVAGYNLEIEIKSNDGKNFNSVVGIELNVGKNFNFEVGIEFNDDKNTSVTLRFRSLLSNDGKG